jgi:anti-sigma factor RsiW
MMDNDVFEKWALHAYADGQTCDEEKRAVEELLASSEDARKFLAEIRWQNMALHKAYDSVLEENVPPQLLKAAARAFQTSPWPRWALAASLAALVIGGGSGWFANNLVTANAMADALPQRAMDAFVVYGSDVRHPVEVAASEKDHLETWLSKRIGVKFSVPDLSQQGYSLVGGRLLSDAGKPAGLLMYEDASKKRMTIYIAENAAKNNVSMVVEKRGNLVTCYWVEPDMVYALAGEQSPETMLQLANAAHEGFDKES